MGCNLPSTSFSRPPHSPAMSPIFQHRQSLELSLACTLITALSRGDLHDCKHGILVSVTPPPDEEQEAKEEEEEEEEVSRDEL